MNKIFIFFLSWNEPIRNYNTCGKKLKEWLGPSFLGWTPKIESYTRISEKCSGAQDNIDDFTK